MAQYRQQTVADRVPVRIHQDLADRIPHRPARIRRPAKPHRRPAVAAAVTATLAVVLIVSFAASHRFSAPLRQGTGGEFDDDEDSRSDLEYRPRSNNSARSKELSFGSGSGRIGGDSRFWDKDDRRRDGDYNEENSAQKRDGTGRDRILQGDGGEKGHILVGNVAEPRGNRKMGGSLYNEGGRAELDSYGDNPDDEYDDGIDAQDERAEARSEDDGKRMLEEGEEGGSDKDAFLDEEEKVSNEKGEGDGGSGGKKQAHGSVTMKNSSSGKKSSSKRKPKHHKFSSSSCEMKFLNSTAQIVEPLQNTKFTRFSLHYMDVEERPNEAANWEPRFAGHQSLEEREESFYARDQKINCGFVKSPSGAPSTGFDIAKDDMKFLGSCHIAVSSCIFGNSDRLRTPFSKTITRLSRKNVCFVMFMDEETLRTLLSEGQSIDNMGFMGLWKIVVVKNLPYTDMRRVGKIPKLLAHRLFPSARYSIWLDSKLRLQSDPYLILEYFLWRRGYEYAISNHYDRHCVWDEVLQNKKLNKYNHTVIDQQFEFYQSDGLKKFDPSDPNKLLPSYVPEGSFIVREHTPMSNLFSCLWFNEVERFTPRDQLSFAYTFLKLSRMNPGKHFHLNMFKDCERRAMTKLFHHRAEEKRNSLPEIAK